MFTEPRTSYLLPEATHGTALILPMPLEARMPLKANWPQALAQHATRRPAQIFTRITSRRPTRTEAAALTFSADTTVLVRDVLTRDHDGQPIDLTRSVWPADTTTLTHHDTPPLNHP